METKYITIPFDVERAKRISNGEEEGKIVTRDGKEVRIVCFNARHNNYPIVGLIDEGNYESAESFSKNGEYSIGDGELDCDLLLFVPEWTKYKDGDILISKAGYPFIYNGKRSEDGRFGCYCALSLGNEFFVFVENDIWTEEINGYASKKEIEEIKIKLKESDHQLSKTYLKRFFGSEEKKECEFKPFDKVLVRDDKNKKWLPKFFEKYTNSEDYRFRCMNGTPWKYCIPYEGNEHLLGTSNDPE